MFEVNDILVCSYGYNCHLVDFYKVVGVTKSGKSIKIRQVGEKIVSHDGYGQAGYVKPTDEFVSEKVLGNHILKLMTIHMVINGMVKKLLLILMIKE